MNTRMVSKRAGSVCAAKRVDSQAALTTKIKFSPEPVIHIVLLVCQIPLLSSCRTQLIRPYPSNSLPRPAFGCPLQRFRWSTRFTLNRVVAQQRNGLDYVLRAVRITLTVCTLEQPYRTMQQRMDLIASAMSSAAPTPKRKAVRLIALIYFVELCNERSHSKSISLHAA